MPFETAMERLYGTLTESVHFFKTVDSSFEEETRIIRSYAPATILDELWKCKFAAMEAVTEKQDTSSSSSSHPRRRSFCGSWLKKTRARDGGKIPMDQFQAAGAGRLSFHEFLQSVDHDLLDALYCRWPSDQVESCESTSLSCMDVDCLNRLREKLWMQDQALRRITSKVFKAQSCLKEVVKECDLLLIYMDKTKGLWQSAKKEGDSGFF